MAIAAKSDCNALDDAALAELISQRDAEAVRLVTGRNNQRLFRVAWSILKDRADAEDAVQSAIAELPDVFRLVFVLREIEGASVEETAELLGVKPATVKTRYLRARRRLQEALAPEVKSVLTGAFPFAGVDCERLTGAVLRDFCGDRRSGPAGP